MEKSESQNANPLFIDKYNNLLAFNTKDLIRKWSKKLRESNPEAAEFLFRLIDEQIRVKDWFKYMVWQDIEDCIEKKSK